MSATNGTPRFRADHVGSLLRPQRLLDARRQFEGGGIGRAALQAVEDDCVAQVAGVQEAAGLAAITDGEFRRTVWWLEFIKAIRGIRIAEPDRNLPFSGGDTGWEYYPSTVRTEAKLTRPGDIMRRDYEVLAAATSKTPKITIPSPSRIHFHGGRQAVSREAYPEMDAFWADIATIYREEIAALEAAGCRYIQIDDPVLTYFLDDNLRESVRALGEVPDDLLRTYVALLNECVSERRDDTYLTVHLCRGNSRSKWISRGSYEPIAEAIFAHLDVDAYFLEYDDERSGGFEPLRLMADGKAVVLGLITSKTGELERIDDLRRRVDDAARYVPLELLAISPQCGFASEVGGNIVSFDDQMAKLDLTLRTADAIWGSA